MATTNYNEMTTTALEAALETANKAEARKISAVLKARQEAEATTEATTEVPAEATTEAPAEATTEAPAEATTEDKAVALKELITSLEPNLYHRCEVVPFNSAEWKQGIIVGLIAEKRSNTALYAIRLEDGRRIVKVYNSALLKISDEVVEKPKSPGRPKSGAKAEPLTLEEAKEKSAPYNINIGRAITFEHNGEQASGRIKAVITDRRNRCTMYVIECEGSGAKYYRSVSSDGITVGEEDEVSKERYAKYSAHASKPSARTTAEKVELYKQNIAAAEERLAKLQAYINARKEDLAKAEAELAAETAEAEDRDDACVEETTV